MVDRDDIVQLIPHYVAMLAIVLIVLNGLRAANLDLGFWGEFAVIMAIVVAYRPVVRQLGVAPDAWESRRSGPGGPS